MEKPISVGDLVMVVRPSGCPNCIPKFGRIGTVTAITPKRTKEWTCSGCNVSRKKDPKDNSPKVTLACGRAYQMWRLLRIDPPAIPESVRTEETLKETA